MKKRNLALLTILPFMLVGCQTKANDKVKKITQYVGTGELNFIETFSYDNKQRLKEVVWEEHYTQQTRHSKVTYQYNKEDLTDKCFTYLYDEETKEWNDYSTKEFAYDEKGNEIGVYDYCYLDMMYTLDALEANQYNSDNLLVRTCSYTYDVLYEALYPTFAIDFEYNNKKQLSKEKAYVDIDYDGILDFTQYTVYVYNEDGTLQKKTEFTGEDEEIGYYGYTYDNGVETEIYYRLEDTGYLPRTKNVSTYDSKNRITKEEQFYFEEDEDKYVLDFTTIYEY